MMKGAGSADFDEIRRANKKRDAGKLDKSGQQPDPVEGYQDWHSLVGDDDLEDNPNT